MLDKFLAIISLATLTAFLSVLIWFVREIDLTVVALGVVAMAAADFVMLNRTPRNGGTGPRS